MVCQDASCPKQLGVTRPRLRQRSRASDNILLWPGSITPDLCVTHLSLGRTFIFGSTFRPWARETGNIVFAASISFLKIQINFKGVANSSYIYVSFLSVSNLWWKKAKLNKSRHGFLMFFWSDALLPVKPAYKNVIFFYESNSVFLDTSCDD